MYTPIDRIRNEGKEVVLNLKHRLGSSTDTIAGTVTELDRSDEWVMVTRRDKEVVYVPFSNIAAVRADRSS